MNIVWSQYWNQVHGCNPEDIRKYEVGLQTIRNLPDNIACILASIKEGQNAGVKLPIYDPRIYTNFI